jgi:hypothetical protein
MTGHAPSHVKNATVLALISSSPANQVERKLQRLEDVAPTFTLDPSDQQIIDGYSVAVIPVNFGNPAPDGYTIGYFLIGNDLEQTNAYLYGHLPAVGAIDRQVANPVGIPDPDVLAESYRNAPLRIRDIVLSPQEQSNSSTEPAILNPKSYRTPYGGTGELFWTPAKLSITEDQSGVAATIASQQINYMTPTGQASEQSYNGYAWQGSTYLDPVFQTTKDDALQSASNYAFLSGILFGVAGAAAIAFVQEVPEPFPLQVWWSRRKRKREASRRNSTDHGITKESRTPTGLGWPPLWPLP